MDKQISESSEDRESPVREMIRTEQLPCALGILHQLSNSKSPMKSSNFVYLADEKSRINHNNT